MYRTWRFFKRIAILSPCQCLSVNLSTVLPPVGSFCAGSLAALCAWLPFFRCTRLRALCPDIILIHTHAINWAIRNIAELLLRPSPATEVATIFRSWIIAISLSIVFPLAWISFCLAVTPGLPFTPVAMDGTWGFFKRIAIANHCQLFAKFNHILLPTSLTTVGFFYAPTSICLHSRCFAFGRASL